MKCEVSFKVMVEGLKIVVQYAALYALTKPPVNVLARNLRRNKVYLPPCCRAGARYLKVSLLQKSWYLTVVAVVVNSILARSGVMDEPRTSFISATIV